MAAPGQRRLTACAMARERAYSPMPYIPETGMNAIRGSRRGSSWFAAELPPGSVTAASAKGAEPAVQHQQGPRPAKLDADRTAQHAAIHQPPHRLAQHLRMAAQPAMHRQAESGFRLIQMTRRQSRLQKLAYQELAAAPPLIDQEVRIHAQHVLHQPMIEQRRPYFERMRHAGAIDLGQQTFGKIGAQIQPTQLRQWGQLLAPVLPIEPKVIVLRLAPG